MEASILVFPHICFQKSRNHILYLQSIDKKVPARIRDFIPVLASDNEVYVIAGIAISEKVRVDDGVKTCYMVTVEK